MASDSYVQASIPRFDGQYEHWSMLMENFLRSKEYWQVIEIGVEAPTNAGALTEVQQKELEVMKLKDLKAKNYLFQAIDRTILETILNKRTSKDIWDSMKKKYQGSNKARRQQLQALRSEFETIKMKTEESVSDYFSRMMAIVNKMRIHGDKTEDVIVVEKILRSLTAKFNFVVCAIEESNDVEELSLDELQSSLMVHEQKFKQPDSEERALKVSGEHSGSRGRGRVSNHQNFRGRGRGRGRFNDFNQQQNQPQETQFRGRARGRAGYQSNTRDKSGIECHRCRKFGHYASECFTNMARLYGERSHYVKKEEEQVEEISLLMACQSKEETNKNLWYLDTGCSNHMSGDKSAFSTLDESFNDVVRFGDNSAVSVMGRGQVTIQTNKGLIQTISNVLFVPNLKTNLLSIGQLQEKGYEISIKDKVCKISDANLGLIAQVKMTANRMFPLYLSSIHHSCFSTKMKDVAWLWHFRYGHLNFGGLKTLYQKNIVNGLPPIDVPSEVCEVCAVSKQHRSPFPQGKSWRAKNVLELVHSDLCGPIKPCSNGGKRYFITFIDDFSRKTWVYFLQEKSEALVAFKSFKVHVEKESGCSIKVLRTDRGGEYNSAEFVEFCDNNGIKRQLTAAYSPQQNGVCERKNRTILNMVRSLLSMSKTQKAFWPEATQWSIHILNRSPTFAVQNMTPEEAWSGRKPSVEYFRVFGCIAYARIQDEKRKKLDDKGEKCIFLGVSEQSKAYKLYNPNTKKVVVSRDVIFDENSSWAWESTEQGIPTSFDGDEEIEKHFSLNEQQPTNGGVQVENSSSQSESSRIQPEGNSEDVQVAQSSRPERSRKRPGWMVDYEVSDIDEENSFTYFALFADSDPLIFHEAVKESKWRKAMDDEIDAIERNDTWELMELPKGQKTIGVKWVYKTKLNEKGEVEKYKARLVAKGYKQEYGVDYKEVFAPVARHDTIRLVVALAAQNSWPILQLDVKSAFLHGKLEEEVFIDQPPGYIKAGSENKVLKLKKALYGLKQAPRAWYSRIDAYFSKEGFQKCPYENTLFIKNGAGGKLLIVCVYVDDLIYTGNDSAMFQKFKNSMMAEFDMSDLGLMHYYLGIEVKQQEAGIFISQRKFVEEILNSFQMDCCNPVTTPAEKGLQFLKDDEGDYVDSTVFKQIVGSLMYLSATRPDIMYAVSLISRFMESPKEKHLLAAKRILRYLRGTTKYGLFYKKGEKGDLVGYTDSDYAGDPNDRKSTSGYTFMLGSCAISWSSKKQPIVTLSSTEAEFVAATSCACQGIWLGRILAFVNVKKKGAIRIYCDNTSTIKLSKNPVMHGRSKHIDVRFFFLRDLTEAGAIELVYCKSEEQIADMFTKGLSRDSFTRLRKLLGVCSINVLE